MFRSTILSLIILTGSMSFQWRRLLFSSWTSHRRWAQKNNQKKKSHDFDISAQKWLVVLLFFIHFSILPVWKLKYPHLFFCNKSTHSVLVTCTCAVLWNAQRTCLMKSLLLASAGNRDRRWSTHSRVIHFWDLSTFSDKAEVVYSIEKHNWSL